MAVESQLLSLTNRSSMVRITLYSCRPSYVSQDRSRSGIERPARHGPRPRSSWTALNIKCSPGGTVIPPALAENVLAKRKPLLLFRLSGLFLLRLAERRFCGLLFQEPPRRTRRQGAGQVPGRAVTRGLEAGAYTSQKRIWRESWLDGEGHVVDGLQLYTQSTATKNPAAFGGTPSSVLVERSKNTRRNDVMIKDVMFWPNGSRGCSTGRPG